MLMRRVVPIGTPSRQHWRETPVSLKCAWSGPLMTTLAPSRANANAVARPISSQSAGDENDLIGHRASHRSVRPQFWGPGLASVERRVIRLRKRKTLHRLEEAAVLLPLKFARKGEISPQEFSKVSYKCIIKRDCGKSSMSRKWLSFYELAPAPADESTRTSEMLNKVPG